MTPGRPAALAVSVLIAALADLAAPPGHAAVRPPTLPFEAATLPNGLSVILSPDHSTPIVHLQVWYHVGAKDERRGRTGFAHLFEHLMFKGSKNVRAEQHASMIARVGGRSNAYTTEDVTVFWETVPARYLPLALWLEADRMASLEVDEATFSREREVVKEERRMRVENQPYGRLPEIIGAHAYTVHPYRHTPIGTVSDLEAATVEDVRDFYRTYYVPSNAAVVLVGDFDPREAMELVTKYLGRVPKAERPVPRDIRPEPPQKAERRATVHENWPLSVVVVAYHVPEDGHPDSYPLQVASKILSDGQSARIHRRLVYEAGMALAAFGGSTITEHPNLFYAVAIVHADRTVDEAEQALLAEMDRLREDLITDAELDRARNQFARDFVIGRQSNQQKASALGRGWAFHRDPSNADAEYELLMNTTARDVRRVAGAYFVPANRLVLRVLPRGTSERAGERGAAR